MNYIHKLKYINLFVLMGLMQACDSFNEGTSHTEQTTITDTHEGHEDAGALVLHNGAKWKADASTTKNVSELFNVIADANPVSLEDYHKTGKTIENGIELMISDCRMKGPDHEALHHWLEPLMEQNNKLLEVKTAEEGKEVFAVIRKQIEIYNDYFE